jgi:hypothetical protein
MVHVGVRRPTAWDDGPTNERVVQCVTRDDASDTWRGGVLIQAGRPAQAVAACLEARGVGVADAEKADEIGG